MKKVNLATLGILVALVFGGCSSKSYFQPSKIDGKVDFDTKVSSALAVVNAEGATMENGQFVTKDGIGKFSLPKGFTFFSVKDSGDGILDEDKSKIFKPFGKAKVRTTGGETSTGLGLAISKKIRDEEERERLLVGSSCPWTPADCHFLAV